MNNQQQQLFHDLTVPAPKKQKPPRGRTVTHCMAQMRALHDQLNAALYNDTQNRPNITSDLEAASIFAPFLQHLEQEELWLMLLNTRNDVIKVVRLYRGSLNATRIRIGELFREAIRENAASIIVGHNHPSGNPDPSPDDIAMTKLIYEAGKLLDIELLDHIIIAGQEHKSLKNFRASLFFGSV